MFLRVERHVSESALAAFARAIGAAEERIAAGAVADLAVKLPQNVVGRPEDFEVRVQLAKGLYLVRGRVNASQLESTQGFLRDQLPLPTRTRIQLLMPSR